MSDFDLPPISATAKPEFTDAAACAQWLHSVPLINIAPAHSMLLGELEELNCYNLAPMERLKILEALREPVFFVQTEHAKKFSGRALPLSRAEREIFNNVVALWSAMGQGYQHCLQAVADGNRLSGQAALACQRALDCLSWKMMEHHKCYIEVAREDWRLLHRLYRFAEEHGFDDSDVADPFRKGSTHTTCAQTWVQTLLLALSSPNEQSTRQLAMIARWLERLAAKATIGTEMKDESPTRLAVDLEDAKGATRDPLDGEDVRYIHTEEIGRSLKKRVHLLRKGESPASLRLGDDCVQPTCEQLLIVLYRHWCEDQNVRSQIRKRVAIAAEATIGIPSIHHHIGGHPYAKPEAPKSDLSKKEREEIATFGRISTREIEKPVPTQMLALETWQITDESLNGLCALRAADSPGERISHNQLVGVRPVDGKTFLLGTVRWMLSSQNFDLSIGIRILPGVPQPVAIRAAGINAGNDKYVSAIALPATPALNSPASLVLPTGWFKPRRLIEVMRDNAQQALLTDILDRGIDFERVAYEPA